MHNFGKNTMKKTAKKLDLFQCIQRRLQTEKNVECLTNSMKIKHFYKQVFHFYTLITEIKLKINCKKYMNFV